ncbi:MAG TPA: inositol monophosphatase family protein [Acidimicrobiales bacterium]|nr:inositol monophosphatase family protein [Acidimicrobiales bacterium]
MADPTTLRDLALEVTRAVAPELRLLAGRTPAEDTKSSATDLVTAADRWSESQIVSRLLDARPGDGILAEEETSLEGTSGVRWIIDPIDATTNFVYGLAGYSISIGAEIDGEPAVGVIVDPANGDEFAAALGAGATCNGDPIRVSGQVDLSQALVATGFGYQPDRRRNQAIGLVEVLPRIRDIRRGGGAAMDLANVAAGRLDAYYERGLEPWDIAAGTVLVSEAGGAIGDLDGNPTDGGFVLAAPPGLRDALAELLRSVEADRA